MTNRLRNYCHFSCKDAHFRICSDCMDRVTGEIVRQREILERYIEGHPEFVRSFLPVAVPESAPESARRMAAAAALTGVGPMAAVAGTMAQMAVEAGLAAGDRDIIVDNGGDIYLQIQEPLSMGLFAGGGSIGGRLAFMIDPDYTPVSICSSSGMMGRSVSLGRCDLATVVAEDAALADAAATLAANMVLLEEDVGPALDRIAGISGIRGVLIVKNDRVGMKGRLPRLAGR